MFPGSSPNMLTGSSDKTLRLWDLKSGKCLRVFAGHKHSVLCLAVDWDKWQAISGSADHTLAHWDVRNCVWLSDLVGHEGELSAAPTISTSACGTS